MDHATIGGCTLYHGRAEEVLPTLPDASVSLICTDPPYMGVKTQYNGERVEWDRQWPTRSAYLAWLRGLALEWRRILKPAGSLYVFASPQLAAHVEVLLGEVFHVLNRIQWIKEDGWHKKAVPEDLNSYLSPREEIIFAEHPSQAPEYEQSVNGLRADVFSSIREYLESERAKAGVSFEDVRQIVGCASGSGLPSHWFTKSQWMLPTREQYAKLQHGFNTRNGRTDYLRREYEDLRRPFTVSADVPFTDCWRFETVAAYPGKHPAEKPLPLYRHIIEASSRPGGLCLDSTAGSFAFLDAARQCGRRAIGIEQDRRWWERGCRRLSQTDLFEAPAPVAPTPAPPQQRALFTGA